MKKRISLLAAPLAASAILLSSNVFAAPQTEIGVSYGNLVVGDAVDSLDEDFSFKAEDAVVFNLDHKIGKEFYLEGKYATSEVDEEDVGAADTDVDFDKLALGAGFIVNTGNSIFDTVRVGGGYFKDSYDITGSQDKEAEGEAEGFYLKTGVNVKTGVKGLTLGGEYTYYSGDLEIDGQSGDLDYEYGVATAKATYQINPVVNVNAAADFSDSESGYRVGIAYQF